MDILPNILKQFFWVGEVLHGSLLKLLLGHCNFLNIDILQGSVATRLRCGGIYKYDLVANLPVSLPVKEFWKSVNIWGSYGQEFGVLFFSETVYIISTATSWLLDRFLSVCNGCGRFLPVQRDWFAGRDVWPGEPAVPVQARSGRGPLWPLRARLLGPSQDRRRQQRMHAYVADFTARTLNALSMLDSQKE